MKNSFFFLVFILSVGLFTSGAQTNVSGGIHSNTTWTKANSPYVVTDTVVVFPGYTLTIEPGVVVKFANNKRIEFRKASLVALGIATDSITFTSNSSTPSMGIWNELYFNSDGSVKPESKLNYCNIKYAYNGVYSYFNNLTINNSHFTNNNDGINFSGYSCLLNMDTCILNNNSTGIDSYQGFLNLNKCSFKGCSTGIYGNVDLNANNCLFYDDAMGVYIYGGNSTIHHSTFTKNQTGIYCDDLGSNLFDCTIDSNTVAGFQGHLCYNDSIMNCVVKANAIGLYVQYTGYPNLITNNDIENNAIGIKEEGNSNDIISCNTICNNTSYGIYYNTTDNTDISQNYWCSTDSTTIAAAVYDGYDNVNYGIATFTPFRQAGCSVANSILTIEKNNAFVDIFPNPFRRQTTAKLDLQTNANVQLVLYNSLGQEVSDIENKHLDSGTYTYNINAENKGIYFLRTIIDGIPSTQKLIQIE